MTSTRREALEAWLGRVHARQLWKADAALGGALVGYLVGGYEVIVRYRKEPAGGWELFTPSSRSGLIADALAGASEFCSVDADGGRVSAPSLS